jgi:hypothetical protein
LANFHISLHDKERGILLSYIAIPLILSHNSRRSLKNANSTSCLRTFCNKRENLYGLNSLVDNEKDLVNTAIQYGIEMGSMEITPSLSLKINRRKGQHKSLPPEFSKATETLARFVRPYEIPTTFKMLGVMQL